MRYYPLDNSITNSATFPFFCKPREPRKLGDVSPYYTLVTVSLCGNRVSAYQHPCSRDYFELGSLQKRRKSNPARNGGKSSQVNDRSAGKGETQAHILLELPWEGLSARPIW